METVEESIANLASSSGSAFQLISADDFMQMMLAEPHQLVSGRLVPMSLPGDIHGIVCITIASILRLWARQNGYRVCGNDTGVVTRTDPDSVRGPDVALIPKTYQLTGKAIRIGPPLIVEILSPSNTRAEVIGKAGEYFGVGTKEVWVVDPKTREAEVFRPDMPVRRVLADGQFETDVLPGFSVPLTACFEDLDD